MTVPPRTWTAGRRWARSGSRAQVRGQFDKHPDSGCRLIGRIGLAQEERSLGSGHLLNSEERASIDSFVWPASIRTAVGT